MKVGSLTADKVRGGGNTITSEGKGDATITGDISAASAGKNSIELKGADSTLTSQGSITADGGTNSITLSDGTISVQSTTKASISIIAKGGVNAENNFTAKTINMNLKTLGIEGNHASTNVNAITATEALTMQTESISASSGSWSNVDNKNVVKGANNSNVTTGSVSGKGGTNEIVLTGADSTFTSNGNISANAGTNKILVEQGTITIGSQAVSYTHLTLPTIPFECRSRWSPYH